MKFKWIAVLILSTLLSIPSLSMGFENKHFFDCSECHLSGGTLNELAGGNICLRCHNAAAPLATTFNAGSRYNSAGQHVIAPTANFDVGDASDSFGNNAGDAYAETSHHWATSTTFNAAAGSKEPNRTLYPNMYSKYYVSTGRVTCSRCHDPHGDYQINPKLLRLSADNSTPITENELCVACHADFDLPLGNHGLIGHPVGMNYAASVAANPGVYKPTIDNGTNGDLQLIGGLVTCLTCHGVHATDSDADTVDGFTGSPGLGDGLLLRHNGPSKANPVAKDGICNACHEYQGHAMSSGTPLDCMVCHGGHEYDATAPNYYMLKKQVTLPFVPKLGSGGTVALDYTVDPTTTSDYTNGTGINGALCLNCHNLPGTHNTSDSCGDCHGHDSLTGSFGASCGSCHGYAPSLNAQGNLTSGGYAFGPSTGNDYAASGVFKDESATPHARHANGSGNYTFSCADCHGDGSGVLSDLPGEGKHNGGTFQQVLDNGLGSLTSLTSAGNILSSTYNASGSGSCSAVYCHSNGRVQGRPESAAIATVTTGPWANGANTISACDICHDVQIGGSKNHSPSHNIHLSKGYACGTCHNDTSADGASLIASAIGGIHVNGTVDATFSGIADLGVGGVYDDTQGTCVTYCHSDGKGSNAETPDWDEANTGNCGDCHGGPSGADSVIASGSHTKHLSNGLSCDDCHGAGAQTGTHAGHLDGDGSAAYDISVDCNICHGAAGGETTGTDRTPEWGNSNSVDCETCHAGSVISVIGGSPAPNKNEALSTGHNLTSGNYLVTNNLAAAAVCTDCHDATAAGHFDAPGDLRLKGGFDCMNCHDGSTATLVQTHTNVGDTFQDYGDFTQLCSACHDPHGGASNAAMINIPGVVFSSRTLTNSFDEADAANADDLCATCHTNTTHNNMTATGSHKEGEDCMNCHGHTQGFNPVGGDSCEDCHAAKLAEPRHAAHINIVPTVDTDLSECAVCHPSAASYTINGGSPDHFNSVANDFASGISNPQSAGTTCSSTMGCHESSVTDGFWQDTDGLNCNACHYQAADPSTAGNNADTNTISSASHNNHFSTGGAVTCSACHDAVSDNSHISNAAGTDAVVLNDKANAVQDEALVNVASGFNDGDNTCATASCHDNGTGTLVTTPNWGTTANCTECHTTIPATAAHTTHLTQTISAAFTLNCTDCHAGAVWGSSATTAGHRDGNIDVTGGYGYPADAGKGAPYNTCATTYCHGDNMPKGTSSGINAPNWGTPNVDGCNFCHKVADTAGFIPSHSGVVPTDCITCHGAGKGDVNATGNGFTNGGATHIDGALQGGGDSCSDCHANVGTGGLSGAHDAHNTVAFNGLLSNGDYGSAAAGWYNVNYVNGVPSFACGYCHPSTVAGHMTKQTSLNPADAGAAGTVKAMNAGSASYSLSVCSATYCHSDGVNVASGVSPNWSAGSISGNCTDCHGNSPTTAAHGVHEVGIHYEELYDDDGVGLMAVSPNELGASGGNDSAHGNSVTSSTITCFTCHSGTVTDSANAANSTCLACHSDTNSIVTGNELARIQVSSTKHLNGVKDVIFADLNAFKSKAQLRDNLADADDGSNILSSIWNRITGYKGATDRDEVKGAFATPVFTQGADTCSTVACHNGNLATWSDSGMDCMYCHTSLPR